MARSNKIDEVICTEVDLQADVSISYTDDPGRTSGPPENCYPPEREFDYTLKSVNIEGVTLKRGMDPVNAILAINQLMDKLNDSIEMNVSEKVDELCGDDCVD